MHATIELKRSDNVKLYVLEKMYNETAFQQCNIHEGKKYSSNFTNLLPHQSASLFFGLDRKS